MAQRKSRPPRPRPGRPRHGGTPAAHRHAAGSAVPCAIVTISDTRRPGTDEGGRIIRRALERAGHPVVDQRIVPDEPSTIVLHLTALAARGAARAVLLTGGTGIAPRDTTYEAVARLIEKRLDGFGEIFRMLSYRRIGSAAMLSRAVGGTFRGMVVFSMPGSPDAVRLAMSRLIVPEIAHAAHLLAEPRDEAS